MFIDTFFSATGQKSCAPTLKVDLAGDWENSEGPSKGGAETVRGIDSKLEFDAIFIEMEKDL